VADRDISGRKRGSGYGIGSKPTQYAKGKSGNLKGRPRGPRKPKMDLRGAVLEKVTVIRNGKKERVPFPIAHIERLKERVAKGDPKADQAMFQLYRLMGIFEALSAASEKPYHITLKIGPTRKTLFGDDDDDPTSSTDNTEKTNDKDEGD
jgi:hypothetical protein